ncbi:hypothetical protein XELAEV_18047181mg [Xenopus laevis]|uniref:Uncharacterized protein n=1 Tax=Xenopus laevis TaxID=8355 RepID=A0A974H197_XENLA|nr:hypothetical protein XELAEV_18047181mg [Xenopus laevis]
MPTILPKEMEGHFPSVIPGLITSDAVYAWAIKEGINLRRVVVIDRVYPLAPVYLAAWPLSMFPRFIGYWFIARAPSEIQDTVRLLWQVENKLPDDGEGPSMIFPHGLPDGCPCVYASLPAQSPKKEKTVVITPSAVYLWALLERVEPCQAVVVDGIPERYPPDSVHHALMDNPLFDGLEYVTQGPSMEKGKVRFLYWDYFTPQNLSDARAAALCNPPSEDEESVGVTGSVDRIDYPEESVVPTDELPSEPEGPVESRENTGLIESINRGDCSTEEALATELPCEPESPEESGPSANVSPCLEVDSTITLLTTELCALNMENSPAIKVACVNMMPECAPAESDPPGGVSEEVVAVEFCTASRSPSLPCSVRVKLRSARKRQRRRARPNRGEDSTAAILYLASTLLELADAKKQMVEPVAEPEVQSPEEKPVPCTPTLVEHERQYVYQGTFSPSTRGMVPVCGLCDLEAPNALEDPGGACLQCGFQLWMGPFHRADQLPLVGTTKDEVSANSILIYEEIEEAPGVSAAAESHVPIPHSEACCNEECAFPSKVASSEGEALETADAVSEVTLSGWTVDVGAAPVPEEPESGGEIMASPTPMPSVATVPVAPRGDADGEIVSEPTADFRLEAVAVVPEVETLQPEVNAAVDVVNVPEEKILTHAIDWRKFSFGRIGSVLPVNPTFRDPPLSESQVEKELTSLQDEDDDWKSVSENAAQIRLMVHLTPSEPGESTHVSELYHLEWGKISLAGEKDWVANIPKPKVDPRMETAPGWEEYDEESPELDDQPAPKESMSRSFTAPPKIGPEEEKDFWVLPGRADPNIFSAKGDRKWGYFMPYAPLWVYERVAASYEDWLIDEILRKEKMHHSCLTNPNEVRRKQDWEYLRSIEREWWYDRTILKNAVKSCGKYNPTKYFSLEVYEGDGQWVDKPHPKYYIPYEDTKAHFLHMI